MQNKQPASFMEATGVIQYNMTNDYMFRYILQKNKKVLKGLICSLLHLQPEQINLEMQVENKHNWTDRSLAYLCRSFDQLYRGQEYEEALPVIHIGFLDYTLFPDVPEFYAKNMLMNVKNHWIYNDKFTLSVVDLSRIELATEEDKAYHIDYWARLFKAKTWEDIKMLAEKNEYLQEAAQSVYMANAEEIVRQKCRAREDAERHERTMKRDMNRLKKENATVKKENAAMKQENAAMATRIAELEAQLAQKK